MAFSEWGVSGLPRSRTKGTKIFEQYTSTISRTQCATTMDVPHGHIGYAI